MDWVTDLRLIWSGVVDFFRRDDESIQAAIVDQLRERGLLDAVLTILAFTRRIEEVWAGVKDVILPVISALVAAFEWWIGLVVSGIDYLEEGFAALGFRFDENMNFWRTLGQVIGVVIVVLSVLAFMVLVPLAAILILVGAAWLVSLLPIILFVGLIVGAIYLIVQIVRLFRWLGGVIWNWATSVPEALATAWSALVGWWDRLVAWGSETATRIAQSVGTAFATAWNAVVGWLGRILGVVASYATRIARSVADTAAAIWAPFAEFGRRVGIFWARLTAADAPWRRWAEPWFETRVNQPIIQPLIRGFNAVAGFLSWVWSGIVSIATWAWTGITSTVSSAWRAIVAFIATQGRNLLAILSTIWSVHVSLAVWAWSGIISGISAAWNFLVTFITDQGNALLGILSQIWSGIMSGVRAAVGVLVSVLTPIVSALTGAGTAIGSFFGGLWTTISDFFSSIIETASDWGRALIDTFLTGIKERWTGLVTWFSENIVEVRDLLPGSDAERGPLSDLTASGSSLVTTFMVGAQAAFPTLTAGVSEGLTAVRTILGVPETAGATAPPATSPGAILELGRAAMGSPAPAGATGGGSRRVSIVIESVNISIAEATPEEAARLTEMVMERIRQELENEGEATFA